MARPHVHAASTPAASSSTSIRTTRSRSARARKPRSAARDADVIVFVVDAIDGLIARRQRRGRDPAPHAPARAAGREQDRIAARAGRRCTASSRGLGFGEPFPVSAIHGEGTGDLLDAIVERLPPEATRRAAGAELSLALIGQPNVGKSSLLNAMLGEERTIVSDVPGTTRDSIDTLFTVERPHVPADRHRRRAQARRQARRDRVLQLAALAARDLALRHRDPARRCDARARRTRTGASPASRSKSAKA